MKTLKHILLVILVASTPILAQGVVTATMRITATVVSGATLNNIQPIVLNLETGIETVGNFKFKAAKQLDTQIVTSDRITIENEFGDTIELSSESIHLNNEGAHSVDLHAQLTNPDEDIRLRGSYTGNINTTINYL